MRRRRGALLLEVLLAVALLAAASLVLVGAIGRAADAAVAAGERARARDVARSALSLIDLGLATPDALEGEVPATWPAEVTGESGSGESGPGGGAEVGVGGGEDIFSADAGPGWAVSFETAPVPFDGLQAVTVRVRRGERASGAKGPGAAGGSDEVLAELTQLVSAVSLDDARERGPGALGEAAERGGGGAGAARSPARGAGGGGRP